MIHGQCLCGAQRFELEPPFELNHHCHCGFCRKHHGSAFATLVGVAPERFTWHQGELITYPSSAEFVRESCATCGTPMPQQIEGLPIFVPAGCLTGFEGPLQFHIFAAHKAPWYEIQDDLPAFDSYPPGVDSAAQETKPPLDPPGGTRGSCLCGDVRYRITGKPIAARHCHCTRCQRGRAAAHASNLIVPREGFEWTAGEASVRRYKIPEAKFFTQCFCGRCGATVPTVDDGRQIAIVPLGGLDDPAPLAPQEHIWTSDIPGWSAVVDDLPQHSGAPA